MKTLLPRYHQRISPTMNLASFYLVLTTAVYLFAAVAFLPSAEAAETKSLSSSTDASASRTSLTTGYVDAWQVGPGSVTLVSLFGYNSGSQQFVQLYDCTNTAAPTVAVSGFSSTAETFTNTAHGLSTGQKIQLTGTVAGSSAGIYFVIVTDANRFQIASTLANARAGTAVDLTGSTATATLNLVPVHYLAVGAADNFSCIVPQTGMKFGKGLLITLSTTGPLYTAPTKDAEFYVTVNQGP